MKLKLFSTVFSTLAAMTLAAGSAGSFLNSCIKQDNSLSESEKNAFTVIERGNFQAIAQKVSLEKVIIFQAAVKPQNMGFNTFNLHKKALLQRVENHALKEIEAQILRSKIPDNIPEDIARKLCSYFAGVWKFQVRQGIRVRQFDSKNGEFAVAAVIRRSQIVFANGEPDSKQILLAAARLVPRSIAAQIRNGEPNVKTMENLAVLLDSLQPGHPIGAAVRYIAAGFVSDRQTGEKDFQQIQQIFSTLPLEMQEALLAAAETLNREKDFEFFLDSMTGGK